MLSQYVFYNIMHYVKYNITIPYHTIRTATHGHFCSQILETHTLIFVKISSLAQYIFGIAVIVDIVVHHQIRSTIHFDPTSRL